MQFCSAMSIRVRTWWWNIRLIFSKNKISIERVIVPIERYRLGHCFSILLDWRLHIPVHVELKLYAEYGLTPFLKFVIGKNKKGELLVFVQNVAYCCLHLFFTRNALVPVAKGCLFPTQETCGGFLEGSGWSNLKGYHFNFAKTHFFPSHNGIIWRWYLFLWKILLDCFCILFLSFNLTSPLSAVLYVPSYESVSLKFRS